MTATLRERAEHAAKYGSNLMVPARDIKRLLDQAEKAEARIEAVEEAIKTHGHSDDWGVQCVYVNQLRRALDGDPQ